MKPSSQVRSFLVIFTSEILKTSALLRFFLRAFLSRLADFSWQAARSSFRYQVPVNILISTPMPSPSIRSQLRFWPMKRFSC